MHCHPEPESKCEKLLTRFSYEFLNPFNAHFHCLHVRAVGETDPVAVRFRGRTSAVGSHIKEVTRYGHNLFLQAGMEEGVRIV